MAAFEDPYATFYESGRKYEFIAEISPKVWKITRKSDRMEYLAQDVTETLFIDVDSKPKKLKGYGYLLAPDGLDTLQMVKIVLNHPNLVSLVDCFALQFSDSGELGRERWFAVWDYCDAGNLGNLFIPSQPSHETRNAPTKGDKEDIEMKDAPSDTNNGKGPKFLPESFCWHMVTSLLRALTWLHDGILDVAQEDSRWGEQRHQPDWMPMLHRDITPQNIFIGYPRRKESYGPVKLGNYGRLFVSGHYPIPGDKVVPDFSKVIGPPPTENFATLGDLIISDTRLGSAYPRLPDQPYTLVSEYRAVGEIIQAMMIEPTENEHVEKIRLHSARLNLQDINYTGRLKNFVVKLMEYDPWFKEFGAEHSNPVYVTRDLYREALDGVDWFRGIGTAEADAYVTSRMAEEEDYLENTKIKDARLSDSFQNVQDILEQFSQMENRRGKK